MKTFVIGSSRVTRLRKFIEKGNDWNLGDHVVKIQGVNGGTVSSMFRKLVDIEEFQPNVVFLQIGSNDIGNSKVTVKDVLMSIEIFIDALLLLGAKCVMFGLLIHRDKVWAKRGLTLHENNSRMDELNSGLWEIRVITKLPNSEQSS
jgi:hypothetical protein